MDDSALCRCAFFLFSFIGQEVAIIQLIIVPRALEYSFSCFTIHQEIPERKDNSNTKPGPLSIMPGLENSQARIIWTFVTMAFRWKKSTYQKPSSWD